MQLYTEVFLEVENFQFIRSMNTQTWLMFLTYPPFKLNGLRTTGPVPGIGCTKGEYSALSAG